MSKQGSAQQSIWIAVSETKEVNVGCLDCQNVFENKRQTHNQQTQIIQHLLSKNHSRVVILPDSAKTSIQKIECHHCMLGNVFQLGIYQFSGQIIILCDKCSQINNLTITKGNQIFKQFNQIQSQKVVMNKAINDILVGIQCTSEVAAVQNVNSQQKVEQISNKPQTQQPNSKCYDCGSYFEYNSMNANNQSMIISHLLQYEHKRIQIFNHPLFNKTVIPQCFNCPQRDIFQLKICFIDALKYLVCLKCFPSDSSILTNKSVYQGMKISQFPSEQLVINNFLNSSYFSEKKSPKVAQQLHVSSSETQKEPLFTNQQPRNNTTQGSSTNSINNNNSVNISIDKQEPKFVYQQKYVSFETQKEPLQTNQQPRNNTAQGSSTNSINNNNNSVNLSIDKQAPQLVYQQQYVSSSEIQQPRNNNRQVSSINRDNINNKNNANNQNNSNYNNNNNNNHYNNNNNNKNSNSNNNNYDDKQQKMNTDVKCLQCKNTFQNERKRNGEITQIVRHLKKCNHFRIQIQEGAQKTKLKMFQCDSCTSNHIFVLSLVEFNEFYMVLCNKCINSKQVQFPNNVTQSLETCKQTPIICDGAINPLIMNLTLKQSNKKNKNNNEQGQIIHLESDDDEEDDLDENFVLIDKNKVEGEVLDTNQGEGEGNKENKLKQQIPFSFKDIRDYQSFFQLLLETEDYESKKQIKRHTFYTDLDINQNKVTFTLPEHVPNSVVKVGRELILSNPIKSNCIIKKFNNQTVTAFLENPLTLPNKDGLFKNVKVSSVYPKIIFERLFGGLISLSKVSPQLQNQIYQLLPQKKEEELEKDKEEEEEEEVEANKDDTDSQDDSDSQDSIDFINPQIKIHLNESQIDAIKQSNNSVISLIQGPPGTGKTETAAYLVVKLCEELIMNSKKKILVCAPSNLAADNIANRIYEINNDIKIFRVISLSRQMAETGQEYENEEIILHKVMGQDKYKSKTERMKRADELLKHAQVICTTCINSVDEYLKRYNFDTVVIDESNQAIEPECIIALSHRAQKLVLVGDHKQLPPIVASTTAAKNGLRKSMFSRFIQLGLQPMFLQYQYRMHPQICNISSTVFYSGNLLNAAKKEDVQPNLVFPWSNKDIPVQFYNIEGQEITLQDGCSYQNQEEAKQVLKLVNALRKCGIKDANIGIVTAYSSQSKLIKKLVGNSDILIDTTHSFQGKEKDYVIFSCVRSNRYKNLGVMRSPSVINVSITRARRGLLIVGNKDHLINSKWWKQIMEMLQNQNLIINVNASSIYRLDSIDSQKQIFNMTNSSITFINK